MIRAIYDAGFGIIHCAINVNMDCLRVDFYCYRAGIGKNSFFEVVLVTSTPEDDNENCGKAEDNKCPKKCRSKSSMHRVTPRICFHSNKWLGKSKDD